MTFYEYAQMERSRLLQEIETTKSILKSTPKGIFKCYQDGNYCRWYHIIDGKPPQYIPKKNIDFAAELATSTFFKYLLDDLERELRSVNTLLQRISPSRNLSDKYLEKAPMFSNLISFDNILKDPQKEWKNQRYIEYNGYLEDKQIMTSVGTKVRSKSEMIILEELEKNGIAYHYEEALTLQGGIFYPDFTIMHPVSGLIIYWEHFGMMDQPGRMDKVFGKLKIYLSNNIFPGYNLIMTFESAAYPLCAEKVRGVIRYYFT